VGTDGIKPPPAFSPYFVNAELFYRQPEGTAPVFITS